MPRSYSFDHFQVPKVNPNSDLEEREGKARHSKSNGHAGSHAGEIHYGQSHAETVARAKAHREEAKAHAADAEAPSPSSEPHAAPAKGQPIGSTPSADQPYGDDFKGLMLEVQGSLELMQGALRDLRLGVSRLLHVPRDAARLARGHLPWVRA